MTQPLIFDARERERCRGWWAPVAVGCDAGGTLFVFPPATTLALRDTPHSQPATFKSPGTRDRITTPSASRIHALLQRASCERARSPRPDDSSETYRPSVASRSIANNTYTHAIEPSAIAQYINHNGSRAHSPRGQEPYAGRRARAQSYVDSSKRPPLITGRLS